jgi:hypothetical protein
MYPYDYNFAIAHQQELITIAQRSRSLKQLQPRTLPWRDRMLLKIGDWMIFAGTRLRSYSKLRETALFNELSRENL